MVVAAAISSAVLLGLVALVASPAQDPVLISWIGRVWVVAGLWLVFGPLWEAGRNRVAPAGPRSGDRDYPADPLADNPLCR